MSGRSGVLILHGQPGAGADFVELRALLEPQFEVLAPDRPGWGSSAHPAGGLADNADLVAADLERASPTSSYVVVGHSLGGGVALELALRHRALVSALVLVGSVSVTRALTAADYVLGWPVVGNGILVAGVSMLRSTVALSARLDGTRIGAAAARRLAEDPAVQSAVGGAGGPLVGRSRRTFITEQRALLRETADLDGRVASVGVPTAVMTGRHDRVVPPAAARELAARIPGAELIVRPGGHLLPFNDAAHLAGVVRRYAALSGRSA